MKDSNQKNPYEKLIPSETNLLKNEFFNKLSSSPLLDNKELLQSLLNTNLIMAGIKLGIFRTPKDADTMALENTLSELFGLKPRAKHNALSPEQQDIESINNFLSKPQEVFPFLQEIENDLKEIAEKEGRLEGSKLKGFEKGKPYNHNKLLSSYLRQQAKDNGFTGYTRLTKFLTGSEFCSMLSQGGLFKDNTLRGPIHGDFTHFIQWLLIIKWNNKHTGEPKLHKTPAELFKWIGEQKDGESIWANSFEIGTERLVSLDFGNVAKSQHYFLSEECEMRFPVFYQLMAGRAAKGPRQDPIEPQESKYSMVKFN